MGFVDRRAGLGGPHATGIDASVAGIEKDRLVAIAAGRCERHAGSRGERRSVERLTPPVDDARWRRAPHPNAATPVTRTAISAPGPTAPRRTLPA